MIAIRTGFKLRKIKITMEILECYFSLGYKELQVNRSLLKLLGLSIFTSSKAKHRIEEELVETCSNVDIDDLRVKCAEMGKLDAWPHLTPKDIENLYSGYIKLMCNLGNLYIVADRKAKNPEAEPFIIEESKSREETFKKLGLEANKDGFYRNT